MSYTFTQTGSEIQAILDRAEAGGQIDQDIAAKQDALTFDAVPTEGSTNPAESGGIYGAIQAGGAAALAAFATDSVSGDIVSFSDGADGIPVKSFSGTIIPLQSGSGDPAPNNVRPISGWSGAEIYRTGINVWDEEWEKGNINDTTGAKESGTAIFRSKNYIPVKPNTTYYFCGASPIRYIWAYAYDKDQNFIGRIVRPNGNNIENTAQTTPDNCYFILFKSYNSASPAAEYVGGLSINYPSTDTACHAYNGQTILLTFGSTVYAGTITALGGGKWSIQPTHGMLDLGAIDYSHNGTLFYSTTATGLDYILCPPSTVVADAICSAYPMVARASIVDKQMALALYGEGSGQHSRIFIEDTAYGADTAAFKSAMSGVQLCYPLATLPDPIIVDASDLATLLGSNTVWTDVGSVTELEYRADTALYVQKLIGGGSLSLSMASPTPTLTLDRPDTLTLGDFVSFPSASEPEVVADEPTEEQADEPPITEDAEPGLAPSEEEGAEE